MISPPRILRRRYLVPVVWMGPLLGDISPVSSGVALATVRINGDEETFERLIQLSEGVGLPPTVGDKKWFSKVRNVI